MSEKQYYRRADPYVIRFVCRCILFRHRQCSTSPLVALVAVPSWQEPLLSLLTVARELCDSKRKYASFYPRDAEVRDNSLPLAHAIRRKSGGKSKKKPAFAPSIGFVLGRKHRNRESFTVTNILADNKLDRLRGADRTRRNVVPCS